MEEQEADRGGEEEVSMQRGLKGIGQIDFLPQRLRSLNAKRIESFVASSDALRSGLVSMQRGLKVRTRVLGRYCS